MCSEIRRIDVYDDGNDKYSQYPNEWRVIDSMFGGGKLKLQNVVSNIVINSISAWKITPIKQKCRSG